MGGFSLRGPTVTLVICSLQLLCDHIPLALLRRHTKHTALLTLDSLLKVIKNVCTKKCHFGLLCLFCFSPTGQNYFPLSISFALVLSKPKINMRITSYAIYSRKTTRTMITPRARVKKKYTKILMSHKKKIK